jgi:hypothetical protein
VFGLAVGAFFAYLILLMNPGHTLNIMLPGSLVGLIVGYATQQHVSDRKQPETPQSTRSFG